MKKVVLSIVIGIFVGLWAHAQTNVETTEVVTEVVSPPLGASTASSNYYVNNLKMREDRKIGIGFGVGGPLGFAGVNVELNIEDENAVLAGFGAGDGYNTFHLQWKHSFEGQYFTPYFSTGYSRWYNSEVRNLNNSSYVLNAVLSDETRQQGPFGADFLVGSVGLQYNQLDSEWMGAGFYFEFNVLGSINKSILVPSGSLGAIYYF